VRSAVKASGDGKGKRTGVAYALRFTAYGERRYVTLGRTDEGWTEHKAEEELRKIKGEVRDGTWKPWEAAEEPEQPAPEPTFHEFASEWFEASKDEWREATRLDYQWQLQFHLLPYFKDHRLSDITIAEVDRYRQSKLATNRAIEAAAKKGKPRMLTYTHPSGNQYKRPERPLSATSINKTITRLGQILEVAVERELIDRNPAKIGGKRRKLKTTKPDRVYLDRAEQIEALLAAAGNMDRDAKTNGRIERRALLATLTFAGLRISEAIDLQWRDINLAGARLRVRESKTGAGVRNVDLLPTLLDELTSLKAKAGTVEQAQAVFPSAAGTRQDRNRVRNRVLAPAIRKANEQLIADGSAPLPDGVTLHALRRTFCSLLVALGRDPAYVMKQMGHSDPTVTLGIYAKVMDAREEDRARLRSLVGLDEDPALDQAAAGDPAD
jgi:integrase